MFKSIGAFFSKWFSRLRAFAMLAGAWGVLFSVITIIGFRIGFEYDDGLVFSTPACKAAEADTAQHKQQTGEPAGKSPVSRAESGEDSAYWSAVNSAYKFERIKPLPWLTAWFFKVFGFKVDIFCSRGAAGSDPLRNSWRLLADNFHFTADENQKYELLEQGRFALYFTPSDEGVIQAKKADVVPVRIRKNKKSVNPCLYHPGKFGERVLPLSEF